MESAVENVFLNRPLMKDVPCLTMKGITKQQQTQKEESKKTVSEKLFVATGKSFIADQLKKKWNNNEFRVKENSRKRKSTGH